MCHIIKIYTKYCIALKVRLLQASLVKTGEDTIWGFVTSACRGCSLTFVNIESHGPGKGLHSEDYIR